MGGKKICTICKTPKPDTAFYKAKKNGRVYLRNQCADCMNLKQRTRHQANMESREFRERKLARDVAYRTKNPHKSVEFRANRKHKAKEYFDNRREQLSDGYVRGVLSSGTDLKQQDIPDELVKTKRIHIKLMRFIKAGQ